MYGSIRVTLQYFTTGILGLIISQIFGCLIHWGHIEINGDSLKFIKFASYLDPTFLIILALTFFRIGHGLILLETCRKTPLYSEFIEKKKGLGICQIVILICFAVFGILIISKGNSVVRDVSLFANGDIPIIYLALLAIWDLPTSVGLYRFWSKNQKINASTMASHDDLLKNYFAKIKEVRASDKIFRAILNWAVYDILLLLSYLIIKLLFNFDRQNELLFALIVLSIITFIDYLPFKIPVLKWISNGEFYFGK